MKKNRSKFSIVEIYFRNGNVFRFYAMPNTLDTSYEDGILTEINVDIPVNQPLPSYLSAPDVVAVNEILPKAAIL